MRNVSIHCGDGISTYYYVDDNEIVTLMRLYCLPLPILHYASVTSASQRKFDNTVDGVEGLCFPSCSVSD